MASKGDVNLLDNLMAPAINDLQMPDAMQ